MLFTIRNPVDRIISAFNFHYNKKYPKPRDHYKGQDAGAIFFHDCFPNANLSAAIESLQLDPHPISDMCRTIAHYAFQGYVAPRMLRPSQRKFPHFFYNYQWYLKRYLERTEPPDVIVIRTSHFWNDTKAIDMALGGGEIAFRQPGTSYTHGSEKFKKNTASQSLTARHLTTLCCILHRDLQAYQWILELALNLNQQEKVEAMLDLMDTCGIVNMNTGYKRDLLAFKWEDWYQDTCTDLLWKRAA